MRPGESPVASVPWTFARSDMALQYSSEGQPKPLTDYLSRHPVTGLLVATDNRTPLRALPVRQDQR